MIVHRRVRLTLAVGQTGAQAKRAWCLHLRESIHQVVVGGIRDGKPQHRAGASGGLGVVPRAARALQTLRAGAHAEQPQPCAGHLALLQLRESVENVRNLVWTDSNTYEQERVSVE